MSTFVLRLRSPRPSFALDATDAEREVMARHAEHWQPYISSGQMVVFGPVIDDDGSFGLAVITLEQEEELRRHAAADPAVVSGIADITVGKMLAGYVRPG